MNEFIDKYISRVSFARKELNRPLNLTEKILYSHYDGESIKDMMSMEYPKFNPDRAIMQDATAQMALLQFMNTNKEKVNLPTSIHCDHLIRANIGEKEDLFAGINDNKEVYDFLRTASIKYGIDYWGPGSGIIHQIVLENYAAPGHMIVGTDSHTPNAGGLCSLAIGVGGNDAVDAMMGQSWELKYPKIIGVELLGNLNIYCSPKDIILYLINKLGTKGGTNCVFEYFGTGVESISCAGRATICNMGAEMGATCSIFPCDSNTIGYLYKTDRDTIAKCISDNINIFTADEGAKYDDIITINLDDLKPRINGPASPDVSNTIDDIEKFIKEHEYPEVIDDVLIGSCTNSSYEDLIDVVNIIKYYNDRGIKPKSKIWIAPGSTKIMNMISQYIPLFKEAGATFLACACGPCIGQWNREGAHKQNPNSIVTTFNRNFVGRNDGNPNTYAFITSPKLAIHLAYAGKFIDVTKQCDKEDDDKLIINNIIIKENSERIQKLKPFDSWERFFNGDELSIECELLAKIKGKCTTDHISPAGKWLKYRGHLENISKNLLIRAINAFDNNPCTNVPSEALSLKKRSKNGIIVAEDNYGEGSSREHAAMEPRFLGVRVVLSKSFARIHETNLKKQGILAITFDDPSDYDKIQEHDIICVTSHNINGNKVIVTLIHDDQSTYSFTCSHSYNDMQLNWLRAGSSINYISKIC